MKTISKIARLAFPLALLFSTEAFAIPSLKLVPLKDGHISVRVTSPAQCTWGDLDIICLDLREHLQKQIPTKVFLSIESLDGSVISSGETNIENFYIGKDKELAAVDLKIPPVKEKRLVGVYVCKDSKGGVDCRTKRLQSYKDIFHRHTVELKEGEEHASIAKSQLDPKSASEDSIYYYQPAILGPSGLEVVSEDFTDESLAEFTKFSREQISASSRDASHLLDGVKLLLSGPLVVNADGTITIELPSSDQSKCSAEVNSQRPGVTKLPEDPTLVHNPEE